MKLLSFLWRKSHTELPCFFFHSIWTVLYSESYQFLFPVYLVVFPGIWSSRWIGIGCIAPEVCATVPSQGLVCWGNLRELQLLHDSGNCSCADSCLNSEVTKHRLTFQMLKVLFFLISTTVTNIVREKWFLQLLMYNLHYYYVSCIIYTNNILALDKWLFFCIIHRKLYPCFIVEYSILNCCDWAANKNLGNWERVC